MTDKILHASTSANLTLGFAGLFSLCGIDSTTSLWAGAGVALLIGAAKETLWDGALGRGTPDWQDMAANALGTGAGLVTGFAVSGAF